MASSCLYDRHTHTHRSRDNNQRGETLTTAQSTVRRTLTMTERQRPRDAGTVWSCRSDDIVMRMTSWTAASTTPNRLQRHWQTWRRPDMLSIAHGATKQIYIYLVAQNRAVGGEAAANKPVLAHLRLVSRQHRARQRACTELAEWRQLGDCLLHCEVAAAQRTTDLTPTAGTRRGLVLQTSISQQMWETTGTHQVTICTLQFTHRQQQHPIILTYSCSKRVIDECNALSKEVVENNNNNNRLMWLRQAAQPYIRYTTYTICHAHARQSAMQGSNGTTHTLSRRRATTRFSPERVGCQKQTAPSLVNNPIRWAYHYHHHSQPGLQHHHKMTLTNQWPRGCYQNNHRQM